MIILTKEFFIVFFCSVVALYTNYRDSTGIHMKTFYIVQSFSYQKVGKKTELRADTPIQCDTAEDATKRAERLASKRDGVVAASQDYDEKSDEYGKFAVLYHYGVLPDGILEQD